MIMKQEEKEDFVPFELAKKLKEKGFPQRAFGSYDMVGPTYFSDGRFYKDGCICNTDEAYTAPTISQVLKWLREKKKLHIEIYTMGKRPIKWCHTITELKHSGEAKGWTSGQNGTTYEEAALAGIEYVIENLIT